MPGADPVGAKLVHHAVKMLLAQRARERYSSPAANAVETEHVQTRRDGCRRHSALQTYGALHRLSSRYTSDLSQVSGD